MPNISSPMKAVNNVEDYAKSTKLLASTTLRTILGTKNLSELLSERETLAKDMLKQLDEATNPWGVKVFDFIQLVVINWLLGFVYDHFLNKNVYARGYKTTGITL